MSEPFLSEIRVFPYNTTPSGWAMCNGQTLSINQNQALFSLLGTVYGGNGQTTFALPDLRGRVPIHVGNGQTLGEHGGEEAHTLTVSELPSHSHLVEATSTGTDTVASPNGNVLAAANTLYGPPASLVGLSSQSLANVGGGQAHTNLQPYLVLNFFIALAGIFPSSTPPPS